MSVYYESSWAILSTICIGNVLFGWIIIGIAGLSASSLIPLVTSAAGAIANGLCYYVYYQDPAPPRGNATGASVVADVMWLIQEAGVSFYSYIILEHILSGRVRTIFRTLFWSLMVVIVVARILILTMRLRGLMDSNFNAQTLVNGLHMGYFVSIAAVECVSAFFLLQKFMTAKQLSSQAELGTRLFKHLMHSTEIRLATLALIGVTRAITYFFQADPQQATSTASQLDRFVYTLECLFPIML
ncbi:hypothetical protein ACRE_059080 [Hapsidospora chrysogenum ATCC 11550]|uniref:Uncharacterized protein n=1 Tax=Hapsidospora chrysogenum (strain ATCC 11550 / CBS 779.69 / DSM 880 / IAM 14645 / JCM 23072 / IMI 49137) TaxID=857340 RepID=A0A086T1V7_HAPC1|nr:hypothetical protein ACRE_059080 [Hapsidospora chrysogenum ATCC 11550]